MKPPLRNRRMLELHKSIELRNLDQFCASCVPPKLVDVKHVERA
jgi:hypothetical protein